MPSRGGSSSQLPSELAPVDEAPGLVHRLHGPELPLQPLLEAGLHVRPRRAVGTRLVVDLPADDARVLRVALGDLPDDPLGVLPVDRVRDVHVLARAVELARRAHLAERHDHDLGVLRVEPGRDRVGGRAHHDLDPGRVHRVHDPVHPRELELALARLPARPGGLADAHDGDPGPLHQLDVLVEPLVRHVLVVVGGAVEDGVGRHGRARRDVGRGGSAGGKSEGDDQREGEVVAGHGRTSDGRPEV